MVEKYILSRAQIEFTRRKEKLGSITTAQAATTRQNDIRRICSEIIGEIVRNKLNYKSLPVKAVYTQYSRAKGQPLLNGINLVLNLFERKLRRVKT